MSLTMTDAGNGWVQLSGPRNSKFLETLQSGIKPVSFRKFDQDTKTWWVHWTKLGFVAQLAKNFYQVVDWSSLSPTYQLAAAGAKISYVEEIDYQNPYDRLYVTEDAPIEVVKAAYKALSRIEHPDLGGSEDKMIELNDAFNKIQKLRGVKTLP